METLRYVLLVNGLLTVVSVAYYILLRRETFFGANRLALWLGLVSAVILPLLELPDWRPQPVRSVMERTAKAIVPKILPKPDGPQSEVTITFPNKKTYQAFQTQQKRAHWSWQLGLVLLYILVVFLLLIRFGSQVLSLRKLIRQSVQEPYTDFALVCSETVTSPFSFFHWVFINPGQHTPNELEQILRHERVHVRDQHSIDMLAAEFVCIILWFNPAAYLFRQLLQQTLEFSADRAVLAEGVDAKLYQYNLLKVSLSGSQSAITNHFNASQLKSRIAMLNQPRSTKTTWLKYPVFLLAALTLASAFARPQLARLEKQLSEPFSGALSAVLPAPQAESRTFIPASITESKPIGMRAVANTVRGLPSQSIGVDSTRQQPASDSAYVSPSRYMTYQGGYLYWIVTPKTTLDDFFVMKQEFARHGNTMQLNEIKYDPLYAYIDRISFTVQRPSGGMVRCVETDDDGKPIPTIAGFVGLGAKAGSSGTGGLRYYKNEFPDVLRQLAAKEEMGTEQFIKANRLEYLIHEGEQKFNDLGESSSTYSKAYFQNNSSLNSVLIVNPDGTLSVNEKLGAIRLFINNEPVDRDVLRTKKLDDLYSVVEKSRFNPARKESFTSALLIYTTNNK